MKNMVVKRKKHLFLRFLVLFLFIAVITGSIVSFIYFVKPHLKKQVSLSSINDAWLAQDYQKVYELSSMLLSLDPFHNAALVYKGYAGFYLSVSQTDTIQSQLYLDNAISSLRIALYTALNETKPQICYMLGKAYFYKNTLSSYNYYADLVIKYLNAAQEGGYLMDDIPEYLGLSYASLDMRGESLTAFTNALLVRESDMLLLAIAEQYYRNGQATAAKPYLFKLKDSKNDIILLKSKNLLAKIYIDEENYQEALKENPDLTLTDYRLSVTTSLIKKTYDLIKEYDKDNHPDALKKITDNK